MRFERSHRGRQQRCLRSEIRLAVRSGGDIPAASRLRQGLGDFP